MQPTTLPLPHVQTFELAGGGRVVLHRRWADPARTSEMLEALQPAPWTQRTVRLYGREILQPRLTAWWGDAGAAYTYSGVRNVPQPWPAWMEHLRAELARELGASFNSCLGNLYRDGRDSVALHADDEPELGPEPTIASLSLGAPRRFILRHPAAGNAQL